MNHKPITTETIAAAERLAGVDYRAAERAQVLAKIDEQLDWLRARRSFTPGNRLGPATVFDPRLPGVAVVDQSAGFAPRAEAMPQSAYRRSVRIDGGGAIITIIPERPWAGESKQVKKRGAPNERPEIREDTPCICQCVRKRRVGRRRNGTDYAETSESRAL